MKYPHDMQEVIDTDISEDRRMMILLKLLTAIPKEFGEFRF